MKFLRTGSQSAARAALLLSLAVGFGPAPTSAQSLPGGTTKRCESSEHRQFDFWVGHWEVFGPAGKKVGENTVEVIADGCALLEQWTGNGGVTGKSLNIYDVVDRRWHQTWVDNSGTLLITRRPACRSQHGDVDVRAEPDRCQGDRAAADHLDARQ